MIVSALFNAANSLTGHALPSVLGTVSHAVDIACGVGMLTMTGVYDPNLLTWGSNFVSHITAGLGNIPTVLTDFSAAVTGEAINHATTAATTAVTETVNHAAHAATNAAAAVTTVTPDPSSLLGIPTQTYTDSTLCFTQP